MNLNITPYELVNIVIAEFSQGIIDQLKDNVVGIYLFGSLTYGDFNAESCDIDLMVVVNTPLTKEDILLVKSTHQLIEQKYPMWNHRIEASYTPLYMLNNILPPKEPRPYYGEGIMHEASEYGNEWIINLYLLYGYGKTVTGTDIRDLINKIDIVEVQKACIRDLFKEWEPKLNTPEWLENSHYQSYLVLNLCRILNTVINAEAWSKKASASWVKIKYPEWSELISSAENWKYGDNLYKQTETLKFLTFVIDKVKGTVLFRLGD